MRKFYLYLAMIAFMTTFVLAANTNSVYFDGNTYSARLTGLLSATNNDETTISFWAYTNGTDDTQNRYIYQLNGGDVQAFRTSNDTGAGVLLKNRFYFVSAGISGDDSQSRTINQTFNYANRGLHHIFYSRNGLAQSVYVDGILASEGDIGLNGADNSLWSAVTTSIIGAGGGGTNKFIGCISELWIDNKYINFSSQTEIDKFYIGGASATLGTNGEIPTGTSPLIYLNGNSETWNTNNGRGGNFATITGAYTNCSQAPVIANTIFTPNITIIQPTNNSVFNKTEENLTYESFCTTPNGLNYSLTMSNGTGVQFSRYNDTFINNVSTLNGVFDLKNISVGTYNLNFTCNNVFYTTEVDIISNVTEFPTPVFNISIYNPTQNENLSSPIVPFNLSINITSSCDLFINSTFYGTQTITQNTITTHSTNTLPNGTYSYFYQCNFLTFFVNSTTISFFIQEPIVIPPSSNATNTTTTVIVSTDLSPLVNILIALILFIIAGGVITAGKTLKSGLTGVIGAFILMFASFALAPYSASITLALVLLSFLLMWYFIQNGKSGNL